MLPDPDTLYAALAARDARYDGLAFVCVRTTGIFCRLTCPARTPRRENCTFHARVEDCLAAGYRACKRCHAVPAVALRGRKGDLRGKDHAAEAKREGKH